VRSRGVDAVIERVLEEAKRAGCRVVVTPVDMPFVEDRLARHGFNTAPGSYSLMGRPLFVEGGG